MLSGAIQGKEWHLPLHLDVVANEKRAFGLPSTTVANFTYFIIISTPSFWVEKSEKIVYAQTIMVFEIIAYNKKEKKKRLTSIHNKGQ